MIQKIFIFTIKVFYFNLDKAISNPTNRHFNAYYEIPFYQKNDFIFEFKGDLSKTDFMLNTQKIQSYPDHLKSTLFINGSQNLEFSNIFFKFETFKEKGNKFYRNKNFKLAIESYINVQLY